MSKSIGWSVEVGVRPYRVVAEERLDRNGRVSLRWWGDGNWKRERTGIIVRNKAGALVQTKCAQAERAAREVNARLANQLPATPDAPKEHLTLLEGLALAIHPKRGLYPKDTAHRREVVREVTRAATILKGRTWATMRPADIRELYRSRAATLKAEGHVGKRGAEILVARVLAVAEWLRGEEMIPVGACHAPKHWREKLGEELDAPDPKRPRHTEDELRRILAAAPKVDPRLGLALELGAELRLGQVLRVRRSDLDLATGMLRVRGSGKKAGALVKLIPSQLVAVRGALAGYLAPLEALGGDYPLFPAGQLTGGRTDQATAVCRPTMGKAKPIARTAVLGWFHDAELLAEVPEVKGRGWYGLRRVNVDEAKKRGASREALKAFGGWADTQVPDAIYADQEAMAGIEAAADLRELIRRGES